MLHLTAAELLLLLPIGPGTLVLESQEDQNVPQTSDGNHRDNAVSGV